MILYYYRRDFVMIRFTAYRFSRVILPFTFLYPLQLKGMPIYYAEQIITHQTVAYTIGNYFMFIF